MQCWPKQISTICSSFNCVQGSLRHWLVCDHQLPCVRRLSLLLNQADDNRTGAGIKTRVITAAAAAVRYHANTWSCESTACNVYYVAWLSAVVADCICTHCMPGNKRQLRCIAATSGVTRTASQRTKLTGVDARIIIIITLFAQRTQRNKQWIGQ